MFKATETSLESGAYHARLKDVEETVGKAFQSEEPEDKWDFVFEILEEGYEGQTVKRRCRQTVAPKSTARGIIEGLIGRKIEAGDEFTKQELIGRECDLSVKLDDSERGTFANIQSVMPVRKKSRQAEQAESKQMRDVHDGRAPVAASPPDTEEDIDDLPF